MKAKWFLYATIYALSLLSAFWHIGAILYSPFTKDGWKNNKFLNLFSTYDNPPQGDEKFIREFPDNTYLNRVRWLFRNVAYGLKKLFAIQWAIGDVTITYGNPKISDKYKIKGKYYSEVRGRAGKCKAFEYYSITPYTLPFFGKKCVRIRIGWKITTPKYKREGFAPFVLTFNPIDSYGDN